MKFSDFGQNSMILQPNSKNSLLISLLFGFGSRLPESCGAEFADSRVRGCQLFRDKPRKRDACRRELPHDLQESRLGNECGLAAG
jgi:hypothetical protein